MECTARNVNGSAHCRSSTASTTGPVEASCSRTSNTASTISHPSSDATGDGRYGFGWDGTDPENTGEFAAPGIGCAALPLEGLSSAPATVGPAPAHRKRPQGPETRALERTGATRRAAGTCRSQARPRPARSAPAPAPHHQAPRAAHPTRPTGRRTELGIRLRTLPSRTILDARRTRRQQPPTERAGHSRRLPSRRRVCRAPASGCERTACLSSRNARCRPGW